MDEGIEDKHWVKITLNRLFPNHCASNSHKFWVPLEKDSAVEMSLLPSSHFLSRFIVTILEKPMIFSISANIWMSKDCLLLWVQNLKFKGERFLKKCFIIFNSLSKSGSNVQCGIGLCLYAPLFKNMGSSMKEKL